MIKILDDVTVDKIAAGEVVERPASVIKELVENAIDAKADKIEVEITSGGSSFMRVTDNGIGMDKQNARLAILRHATSKISTADDLLDVHTLGFRGEALPSIAAVSRFCLITRPHDKDLGTVIKIKGGAMEEVEDIGSNVGTTIKVEDLFFNVPARKKFLKTTTTETNKINDFLIKLALSNPQIAFKLINNNKMTLTTPGNNSLYDAIECIYGAKVSEEMLPIELIDEDIKITGFITKPAIIRSSRTWQTLIVNGRVITSRVIYKAIDNAYHSLLPKAGYPFVILNIEIAKNTIDVNVHPQKAEIKFEDDSRVFKAVFAAITKAIKPPEDMRNLSDFATPIKDKAIKKAHDQQIEQIEMAQLATNSPKQLNYTGNKANSLHDFREAQKLLNPSVIDTVEANHQVDKHTVQENALTAYQTNNTAVDTVCERHLSETANLMPIGQIDKCFIVAQGPSGGMYLIDQHAAHERILYDKFAKQSQRMAVQPLLVHLLLDVDSNEIELIEQNQQLLYDLGFSIELAGQQQIRVSEVPADIKEQEAENTLRKILTSLSELHKPTPEEIRHACLAMTACKAAIKAGDVLNIAQMKIILTQLAKTTLPYTCPHGRPTIIKFSTYDLDKMFKRVK